jgi:putative membrane protein
MTRSLFLSLVCTGAFLCMEPASIALAQRTGGGTAGQNPSTSSTPPSQNNPGQTPGMNGPAGANSPDTMTTKVDDKKFVKDAALGGMTEVELGKLAAQKASRDDVKQFGQKMVDDHTKANDELKQVASKESIPIPDALDSKHQSRIDKLAKLSGEAFDKAYVKDQLKDHQEDVKEFNAEAQNGTDPNVKGFASSTLPTLQHHLDMVKDLNKSEKNAGKQSKGQ